LTIYPDKTTAENLLPDSFCEIPKRGHIIFDSQTIKNDMIYHSQKLFDFNFSPYYEKDGEYQTKTIVLERGGKR